MFYFNEGWKPYEKKVAYTETVTEYENDTTRYDGKTNLVIEDNSLTDEELERLEVIRHIDMTLKDVIAYVKTGEAQGQVIELDKVERSRKAILANLDLTTVDPEFLRSAGLSKVWTIDSFLPQGEVVDYGQLYKSKNSHKADTTPDKDPEMEVL